MHWLSTAVLALAVAVQQSAASINSSFVVEIVRKLNDVYHFETFPMFSSYYGLNRESLLADLPQKLSRECFVPQMQFVEPSSGQLKYLINKDTLSIAIVDQMTTEVVSTAGLRLHGMHQSKLLLIIQNPVLLKQLAFIRNFLWEEQFAHVLILFEDQATHQNQQFIINPYPTLEWVNQTSISDHSKLFLKSTNDLKQYRIEVEFTEDLPRVFRYKKMTNRLIGRHGSLITLFAKWMNIDLICRYESRLDLDKILRVYRNKKKELSVHSYPMYDLVDIGSSYPLQIVRWCIMVPIRSEVPKSAYVYFAFDWATWIVIAISFVYIGYLMRFIDPPTANSQKFYFMRSLAMLTYSPNMAERMISPSIRQYVFFSLVFLLGFILSCLYLTYLTSFCTNMVDPEPIDTVEDLIKDELRVMVIDYELAAIRERANHGETILKILYPVSYAEQTTLRGKFDTNYAYTIRQDRWNFLNKQQRGLQRPLFRLSNICFGRHYTMFPLQFDSHLQAQLDYFILLVMQTGLDSYWDEEAFRMAVANKVSKVLVEKTVAIQQLRLDYFKYVFAGWFAGMGISATCFAIELFWKKVLAIKGVLRRFQNMEEGV